MPVIFDILLSLVPVALFLAILIVLDSFKLIKIQLVFLCILWGMICVLIAYYLNNWLIYNHPFYSNDHILKLIPPVTEELLKLSGIYFLIRMNRIGFMIDGAIYGFAIGTGFALLENIYYLYQIHDGGTMLWLVRGFGTAIMHGGTTAIFSVLVMSALSREKKSRGYIILGYIIAVGLHYLYNVLSSSANIATLSVLITVPGFLMAIFSFNEKSIRKWVDLEMDQEVEMLLMIRKGQFSETRAGQYIISLKKHFQPLIMVDILSYIYLYLELSTKAKANLILKENNLPPIIIPEIKDQLSELSILKKNIGKTGMIAIRPILRMNNKDLWKLTTLR